MSLALLSLTVLSMLRQAISVVPKDYANKPIAAAWYTDSDMLTLDKVEWDKYTDLIYSFALTTPSVSNISLDGSNLPQFVSEAHNHGVAAHIAVGGWGGSRFFSSDVASSENRTAFVQTVVNFVNEYQLDGINFDWEYPGLQGIGCNVVSPNDTANFLSFLQELRADPTGSYLTLSAATSIKPFINASGSASTNISGFAEVLDYIAIMDYDVWGSWSASVGPNAPLNDTCASPANQDGSAVSAVKAWTTAGMPINKVILGIAGYGHSFSVAPQDAFVNGSKTELAAYPKFNASNQPAGDSQSIAGAGVDVCGVTQKSGGTFNLWGLVEGGFLGTDGNPAPGIYYRFDACSQTPYVYNETSEVMVSFDNVQSFAAKGKYIKEAGLKGFSMWQAGGDYNGLLLDSIRSAAGYDAQTYKRNWNWNL